MRVLSLVVLAAAMPAAALAQDEGDDRSGGTEHTIDRSVPKEKGSADGDADRPSGALEKKKSGKAGEKRSASKGEGVVVLVSSRDPSVNDAAVAFEQELSRAVAADGRLRPVDLSARQGAEKEAAPSEETEKHLAAAKRAYDNMEFEAAANENIAALRLILKAPAQNPPAEVARVFTLAGAAYLLNGEATRAATMFRRAAILCPTFSPDSNDFSPDILSAYRSARQEASAGSKGNLSVSANTFPASVAVGGVEVGTAPVTLKDLPTGRHHVLVRSRGHSPWATIADVADGQTASAVAELTPLAGAEKLDPAVEAAAGEVGRGPGPGMQQLGDIFSANYVLFGKVTSAGAGATVEFAAYDLAAKRRGFATSKALFPDASTFGAEVKALAAHAVDSLVESSSTTEAGPDVPITSRWWFWAGVGGTAVAAATVAILVLANGASKPSGMLVTGIP